MSMPLSEHTLSRYLEHLPGTTFRKLYQQPSTVLAIFRRMLTHIAKNIVMAILYSPTPWSLADLDLWMKPSATREKDQAIAILRSLHVIQPQSVTLTANFRNSLRLALEGGGDHNSFGVRSFHSIPPEVDYAFLDKYARKKWDSILHYVVSATGLSGFGGEGATGPNKSVKELLVAGRLVERGVQGDLKITHTGFSFLLQQPNAQVWALLILWLQAVDAALANGTATDMDSVDMLTFFFMLASLELGSAYSTDALTESRRNMLPFLIDFGLIYIPPNDTSQFFPTRLATTLTSKESALRSVSAGFSATAVDAFGLEPDQCTVILETNFRMYAYVYSPLQIAVLALFADLKYRFKGLVSGQLTRKSVKKAVSHGITADQIVSYLSTHAHEQMHKNAAANNKQVLPPVIVDQIRLWQLDTERIATQDGYLFKEFDEYKEYKAVADFADNIGVCAWRNDKKGIFFATKVEQIKDFMKSRKKANEASNA
ncbi:transcription factor Tfb2 [Hypoxylon sp. FL1284]|nr:transcription factor Tfb2 [Hypoxylon sp. FL1284]